MHLTFKETKEEVYAAQRVSKHVSPHLHNALEIVCVTEGTLEMGVGQELYHMEKGDIGFVFSDIIHHYQVFSEKTSRADYILVPSSFAGVFKDKIQGYAPKYPVIRAGQIEPDVYNAIQAIIQMEENEPMIVQAYVQIVLARCIGKMELVEKSCVGSDDLIYRTVSYVSGNFRKKFSLEEMAHDLGVSKLNFHLRYLELFAVVEGYQAFYKAHARRRAPADSPDFHEFCAVGVEDSAQIAEFLYEVFGYGLYVDSGYAEGEHQLYDFVVRESGNPAARKPFTQPLPVPVVAV